MCTPPEFGGCTGISPCGPDDRLPDLPGLRVQKPIQGIEINRNRGNTSTKQLMDFLARALIPIAVLTVFALARKYMPATPARRFRGPEYSVEELDARFSGAQWMVAGAMVGIGAIFFVSAHAGFVAINRHLALKDGPAHLVIFPQSAIWWFFPGFGAVALSWEITLKLWELFGDRENALLYANWSNRKVGFDCTKMLRWIAVLVVLPVGILTTLALPMHTTLAEDRITDCGYAFAACKVYRYADARRMTIIDGFRDRDSRLNRRAGIVIDFRGGRRWSSADEGDFHSQVDPSLEEFLANRTHLSYNHAETENDIPPLASVE